MNPSFELVVSGCVWLVVLGWMDGEDLFDMNRFAWCLVWLGAWLVMFGDVKQLGEAVNRWVGDLVICRN